MEFFAGEMRLNSPLNDFDWDRIWDAFRIVTQVEIPLSDDEKESLELIINGYLTNRK